MRLLALGDVCGETGMEALRRLLRPAIQRYGADIVVCNGENADVLGIRNAQAEELWRLGADVITLGNHTWNRRDIAALLEQDRRVIRPLNFASHVPGRGYTTVTTPKGYTLAVVNAVGRLNCDWNADNPFTALDRLLAELRADLIVVDFHAEATSEKKAMGYHLDGRVSAVFGTHTHVPTADERILPKGTGYITDLGMCGAIESVLGVKPSQSLNLFLGGLPQRLEAAPGPGRLEGALFTLDEDSGRCTAVERISVE
jgi:metallophosphoesterase (TIGR00282 family)